MSFSPIYKSFQHLLSENSGVFRLFKKTKNPGMYQAVWQARQAEVDTYRERLEQAEKKLFARSKVSVLEHKVSGRKIKDLEAMLIGKNETIENLKEELTSIKIVQDTLEDNYLHVTNENERLHIVERTQERLIQTHEKQFIAKEKEISQLKKDLQVAHQALLKLDHDHQELVKEFDEISLENDKLADELDRSRHYAKEFRRINGRMENELHRVNSELERVQSRLN